MARMCICMMLMGAAAHAQTTQGLVAGRVTDSRSGRPIAHADVTVRTSASSVSAATQTDDQGRFAIGQLSPGTYRLRVTGDGYQPQDIHAVDLAVAGRVDVDFRLRPLSDVWESGEYRSVVLPNSKTIVTFYGPDIDTSRTGSFEAPVPVRGALESTVSQAVDGAVVAALPLPARDVYTILVTQPGVTADTTTGRSLGLSVNGQRPSASNFLLDGLENNNALVSGPLTAIAPEAISEYRVSTNNFSAEYGRTSGYIANAITRSGSNAWHGVGYLNFKNDVLNANDFQQNLRGLPRSPVKENQTGIWVGGPLRRDSLLVSGAFEHTRNRGRSASIPVRLPTLRLLDSLPGDSTAKRLLTQYPAAFPTGTGASALVSMMPTVSIDRDFGMARVDKLFASGKHRLTGRTIVLTLGRPDFVWTPYKDFQSSLVQDTNSTAVTLTSMLSPGFNHEARIGYSRDRLTMDRAHPEVPNLAVQDQTILPGSPVFSTIDHTTGTWEFVDNVNRITGRHFLTAGGGVLRRGISGTLTAGRDGQYAFNTIADFAADRPNFFRSGVDRGALPSLRIPDFYREYSSTQFYFFAQDTWRPTSRLVLNFGVRYESFGAPVNTGTRKDALVELGSGASLAERVAGARITYPSSGDQRVYQPDRNDWGGRLGFSYRVTRSDKLLLRGSVGTFYDRLFDNLWQNVRNNNFVLPTAFTIAAPGFNYLMPVSDALRSFQGQPVQILFPTLSTRDQIARIPLTLFQPYFRTPYVQSYFLGLTSQWVPGLTLEVNALGSVGRKLLTTDILNRGLNRNLGPISYRANQGSSSYNAMTVVARHRSRRGQINGSYTWSHTIDNQSEALRSDYYNLSPTRLTVTDTRIDISGFSRQFDSSADRGNSDFDQRHNLVFYSAWELPGSRGPQLARQITRGWSVSQIAAFRSGFPYTVFYYGSSVDPVLNNRANLVSPERATDFAGLPEPAGGVRLLSAAGFGRPATGTLGNTGRNAFRGPGFYNVDASLSRTFALPWLGEAGRLVFRADALNVLNHTNLNVPESQIGAPGFGVATYGRRVASGPGLANLSSVGDTARQIQLLIRIAF